MMNKVNKEKYFVKWSEIQAASFNSSRTNEQGDQGEQSEQTQIPNELSEIQTASFKSLRTSEQGEQSEQTKILCKMNWDSDSCI